MSPRTSRALVALLFVAFTAIVVRLAWISDDAYITLRTVENWFQGHGLRWNVAERTQTHTHPLWMFVLAAGRAVTGEVFFSAIALGIALTLTALVLLLRLGRTPPAMVAILAGAAASRAFCEFATSGLENPLAYVMLVVFVATATGDAPPLRRLSAMALLTGLATTTRLDLVVLCAPALLAAANVRPRGAAALRVLLGLSPLLAWLLFAVVYYGTPWPVVAYAKAITVGIPQGELLLQGLHWLWYVTTHDPATVAVVVAGVAAGLACPRLRARLVAVGVLLYCGYVVKVGGDFMGGRFATPPFVAALAILARWLASVRAPVALAGAAATLALSFAPGLPPYLRPLQHDENAPDRAEYRGIGDERLNYWRSQGLLSSQREVVVPGFLSDHVLRGVMARTRPVVMAYGVVGKFGFFAGDLVHICDPWLCDPLLMRLPAHAESMRRPDRGLAWQIGHFERRIPEGYLESLATGQNRIHHPGLRRYYDALRLVVRAPTFDGDRLAALSCLLCGDFDADLRQFVATDYTSPPRLRVPFADLSEPRAAGTHWFDDERVRVIYAGGLHVDVPPGTTAATLRLMLHGGVKYRVRLRAGAASTAELSVDAWATPATAGLRPFEVAVPAGTGSFDAVWVDGPTDARGVSALGSMELVR